MKSTLDELVTVGRFGAPYGVKGWIKVHSYTEPADNILSYAPWEICQGAMQQTITVLDGHSRPQGLVVQLAGFNDRDAVAKLTNQEISVARSVFPPLAAGEYYWDELIGLTVINRAQVTLGIVESLLPTGAHDVLVIRGQQTHLIPYVRDHFIDEIDLVNRCIRVDWDETD